MNPTTFRPSDEVRELLAKEQQARPGVPVTYIINEKLVAGFAASRRTTKRPSRGAVVVEGGSK